MTSLALLGKGIAHSRSPEIYARLLGPKISYKLFDYHKAEDIPPLENLFQGLDGLSITAPYKTHFLGQVQLMPEAQGLGAINCIRHRGGAYQATNTDYLAMEEILASLQESHGPFRSLAILGDGSMARVTETLFARKALTWRKYSRKTTEGFDCLDLASSMGEGPALVVNTCARQYEFRGTLPNRCVFWDHNYSLPHHAQKIPSLGAVYLDGLGLLENQAIHALGFWGLKAASN